MDWHTARFSLEYLMFAALYASLFALGIGMKLGMWLDDSQMRKYPEVAWARYQLPRDIKKLEDSRRKFDGRALARQIKALRARRPQYKHK